MLKAPVFILGCHKSGTSLLRNLLDGHPSFFIVPTESHFFQNIGFWVSYYFRRSRPKKMTFDEMKMQLSDWITLMNNRSNDSADGFTMGKWNIDLFNECLYSRPVDSIRDLSDLYVESMYYSLYNTKYNDKEFRFVEKSVENVEFALDLLKLYPQAKFIHIVRNPYSNLVAIRKFMSFRGFPVIAKALTSMYTSYYYLYKNQRFIDSDKYFIVTYEDLIKNPEKTMKSIADFLGITYTDILLKPSLFGKLWTGNSSNKVSYSGISSSHIDKWKQEISNYEIIAVNELFNHVLEDFNFEIMEKKGSLFRMSPKENLYAYLVNRFLFYYLPKFSRKSPRSLI